MSCLLLKGKRGIIFGALNPNSIAWTIAEKCYKEGATFTLTNTAVGIRLGNSQDLADQCKSIVIPADATDTDDLINLYEKSIEFLGGKIDFVLHSIGMSKNVLKNRAYHELDYHDFLKTLDISAVSLHKVMQIAYQKDYLNEFASVITLSYIGAHRVFEGYSDMSHAKALLESIVRNFGYHYGKARNVRINAVSQSPAYSTASKAVAGFDKMFDFSDQMSPLGNATSQDCAGLCVSLFSDLTTKLTMQTIYNDGGFSTVGMSSDVLLKFMDNQP
jgi:enoyl-[acyl-carrier protein] reductase I